MKIVNINPLKKQQRIALGSEIFEYTIISSSLLR